jgi:hypothetical protein
MNFEAKVLKATKTDAVVQLPVSGIMVTFRCPRHVDPVATFLVEIDRMQPSGRLEEHIRISAGALQDMRTIAAEAIAKKREEEAETMRNSRTPFQLPLSFR